MIDDPRPRPSPPPRPSGDGQWARLRVDADSDLRRGAWYRVLGITAGNATLSINGKPVLAPREHLELRSSPPRRWTVVLRPTRTARAPEQLRPGYLVCPSCRHRAQLPQQGIRDVRCPRCNVVSEVAWEENYLGVRPSGAAE